jgi:hypothetical protein
MRFKVEYTGMTENRLLIYRPEEHSFDTEPIEHRINFDIVVNKLNLTSIDDNKIVQVWGFCGLDTSMKSNYNVPQYKKGALKVIDDLEPGFSYSIYKEEQPVYINVQTGWLCIGNPEKKGNAVEFIRNCVAVIDDNQNLISLWLKPDRLPDI